MRKDKFIEFIADIFEVNGEDINLDIVYGEYQAWDSLMMMRLIMETEEEYGVSIPIETAGKINTLNDLYKIVEDR